MGPNELLTMFAMDWAASTRSGNHLNETRQMLEIKKANHFDHECPVQRRDRLPKSRQLEDLVGRWPLVDGVSR